MTDKPQFVGKKVTIGELGKTQSGGTPSSKHPEFFNGSIPWIGTTALNGKFLGKNDAVKLITEEAVAKSATKIVPEKSIMVGIRVGVGKVAINAVPMCTSQDIVSIVGIDEASWNKEYISLALQYKAPLLAAQAQGATIAGITSKTLKAIEIPAIPINEQNRVVDILRKLENQVGFVRKQLCGLDALVKSRFIEMFGDLKQGYSCSSCRLGSISRIGSSRRVFRNELLSEGIPFYRGTEIAALSMGSETSPSLFISKERYDELVAITGKPEVGDLLLPSICPDGQIWRVDTGKPFYFKDGRVLWIHPNREIVDSIFLRHALSILFQMSFSDIASGTTFAEMKIFLLKELEVPLPDITVQKKFAAFVAQVDKSRFGGMLRLLNSLSGIMHASFFSVADTD